MKKIAIALVTAMVLAMGCLLVGCSEESPSDVTKTYLDALKSQDSDAYSKVYADGDVNPLSQGFAGVDSSKLTDDQKAIPEMTEKMLDFDYTIGEEQVDGDKATVKVTIKTYKLGDAFSKSVEDYLSKAVKKALSGKVDEDEMSDLMMECFSDQLSKLKDKDYEKSTTFNLTNGDDGWTIDELTDDQIDVLTGGLVEAASKLADGTSSK